MEGSGEKPMRKRQKRNDGTPGYVSIARKRGDVSVADPKVTFANIGGCAKVIESICQLLIHMKRPEIFTQLGISPPRGFLLYGPPGCGKTLLAYAIAGVNISISISIQKFSNYLNLMNYKEILKEMDQTDSNLYRIIHII